MRTQHVIHMDDDSYNDYVTWKKERRMKGRSVGEKKGDMSKTRVGDMDYTTKSGDKDFHEGGKDVKKMRGPY